MTGNRFWALALS